MRTLIALITLFILPTLVLFVVLPAYSNNEVLRTGLDPLERNIIRSYEQKINTLLALYQIPGAAVALVDDKGIVWAEGFGVTNEQHAYPVTPDTLFSIESQSKMFTALGVMRAVQTGQLSLNVPITNYIPTLKVHSVFQQNPAHKITLINLLSHTAGFAHEAPVGNNYNSRANFQQHIDSILYGTWLQFPIGQGYNYSNVGVDLAGYILQVNSKEAFASYMKSHVLNPLGMLRSTFDLSDFLRDKKHAVGHIPGLAIAPYNYSIIPAGGMYSSVDDLSHYLEFQLNKGVYHHRQILNPKLLSTLLSIPFPHSGQTEGSALGIWKGQRLNTVYYSHLGRGFGFASDLEWYPQYHLGVVVLTNKYDMNNIDIKIAHLIVDGVINQKNNIIENQYQKNNDIKYDLKPQIINKYLAANMLGHYISSGGTIELIKDAKTGGIALQGSVNWGPAFNNVSKVYYPLVYIGNDKFYSPNSHEYYLFTKHGITGVKTFSRISDSYRWFYNESFSDPFGPNESSWQKFIGTYDLYGYGPVIHESVSIKNGYIYFNDLKLREFGSGIFSAADGEMLVFNKGKVSWDNLPLIKEKNK